MSDGFESKVVFSGIGQSAIGRRLGLDPLRMTADACIRAVADAGLEMRDIDGLSTYPGSASPGPGFNGASLRDIHDVLGLKLRWMASGIESAGQLGSVVVGMMAVATGMANHVLCWRSLFEGSAQGGGGRKAYGGTANVAEGRMVLQLPYGATAVNMAAMQTRARMHRYGLTKEQLGAGPIVSRRHAGLNPNAIYKDPLSMDDYLGAKVVSTPLGMFDCDVPCDAATAIVISRADHATNLDHAAVGIEAVDTSHLDRFAWEYGEDITRISSRWATGLWDRTTLRPTDVDVAELYDGFSIFTHSWLEDLGFCDVGEAGAFVEGGERISLGGELPLNTHGGQLSAGRLHGYGFLHEACVQLRSEGGRRQVPGAEVAAIGVGASNSGTTAMVLTRV